MSSNIVPISKIKMRTSNLNKAEEAFLDWHSKKQRANQRIPEALCRQVRVLASEYSTKELMASLSLSYGTIRKITEQSTPPRCKDPKISKKQKSVEAKWIEITPQIQNFTKSNTIEFCRPDGFKMTISDQQLARDFAGLFLQGGLS